MTTRPEYIDIHSHINFAAYDEDRDAVIERAKEANVWMINVGTYIKTSEEVIRLAEKHEGMYAIIGLHPVHTHPSARDFQESDEEIESIFTLGEQFESSAYEKLIQHPKVVGIGECGLDFFHLPIGKEEEAKKIQEQAFRKQIELAMKYDKPIMIHARQSYKEILSIIDEYLRLPGSNLRGNAHFFAGTIEEARAFIERGFTLSFTGVITFAKQYKKLVEFTPLDRIMSETDCPYVSPMPYRGKRNEPSYVVEITKKIAEIKAVNLEEVKSHIIANAFRSFNLN